MARAGGQHDNAVDGGKVLARKRRGELAVGPGHGGKRMRDGIGLFMDFLFHEVAVPALVDDTLAGGDDHNLAIDRRALCVEHLGALGTDDGIVIVFQIDHIARQVRQGHGIGSDEAGPFAKPDGKRRGIAGHDHHVRMVGMHGGKREGSLDPCHGLLAHLLRGQPVIECLQKQVRQHF